MDARVLPEAQKTLGDTGVLYTCRLPVICIGEHESFVRDWREVDAAWQQLRVLLHGAQPWLLHRRTMRSVHGCSGQWTVDSGHAHQWI